MKRWTKPAGLAVGLAYLSLGALALSGGIVSQAPAVGDIPAGIESQGRALGVELVAAAPKDKEKKDKAKDKAMGRPFGVELVAAPPAPPAPPAPEPKRAIGVEFVAPAPPAPPAQPTPPVPPAPEPKRAIGVEFVAPPAPPAPEPKRAVGIEFRPQAPRGE